MTSFAQSRQRRNYAVLQAGRAIAALLVVLHHVSSFVGGEPRLWSYPQIGRWLMGTSLGVAFFFVLSGIVILTAHWHDIGDAATVWSYATKRVLRIYPIYWLVLALVLCGQLTHADLQFPFHRDPYVVLSSILLIHIHSTETNLVVAWTLFHEMAFYAVFATLLINRRIGVFLLTLWFCASLVSLFKDGAQTSATFPAIHLLFGFGMFAAWLLQKKQVPVPRLMLLAGTFLFCAAVAYSGQIGSLTPRTYMVSGFGSMLALLGASEMERFQRLSIPRWLVFLGDASYAIYLIHYPVISHLAHLCFRLDAHLHLPVGLWMLMLLLAGTGAGSLLHVVVERPLLNWLRRSGATSARQVTQTA
ncbi:acyltransferase family protein [Granulicella arctica]|uniref:acyltransferase family protein n=1 Tax=Granulicella arctica TaxID=940613 RepID=UPI0021E0DE12|nr:acyltransferase [Granulicella arctica]